MKLDQDGQPQSSWNHERRSTRDVSEMLGLVRGLLADGVINETEVRLLHEWAQVHHDAVHEWPGSKVYERLESIFADNRVDEEEITDLRELLEELVGGESGMISGQQAATTLPLDKPAPKIEFRDRLFVFTGKCAFGPRKACEQVVASFGGKCHSGVTKETNYIVVGTFGSRDWQQSSHGTKILRAVEYRDRGLPVAIVSEEHWATSLPIT